MQTPRTLTSDLAATATVDPELRRQYLVVDALRDELKRIANGVRYLRGQALSAEDEVDQQAARQLAEERLYDHKKCAQQLHDARACLVAYRDLPDDERPQVVIRFLPPAKVTEFKVRSHALRKEKDPAEQGVAGAELDRMLLKWGMVGWRMHDPDLAFSTSPIKFRGREFQLASWDVVDMIEATGWLGPLAQEILEYNDLDSATMGKSSRPAGTRRGPSTAASAKNAPA